MRPLMTGSQMLAGSVMLALFATPLRQRPSSPALLWRPYVERFDARALERLI